LELRRLPRLTWQRRRIRGAATAYGLPWRPEVELAPGTVILASRDQQRFDSIALHELAHVRNRDVLIGAAAAGSLAAFVLVADLPLLVSFMASDLPVSTEVSAGGRMLVLTGAVFLLQRELLRVRELEADLRALSVGEEYFPPVEARRAAAGWRRVIHTHPGAGRRSELLDHPERLLSVSPLQAGVAGFFALLPVPTAGLLVSGWLTQSDLAPTATFMAAAALAAPLGAWLGVAALRIGADSGRRRSGAGMGLSAGVGCALALAIGNDALYQPIEVLSGRFVDLLALLLVVLVLTGLVVWLVAVARRCIASGWSARRSGVVLALLGAGLTGLLLGLLSRVWTMAARTEAGQSIGYDPAFALLQLLWVGVSAPFGGALLVLFVAPFLVIGRGDWLRLARALAVIVVAAGVGWVVVWLTDARLDAIASREVQDQSLVESRHLLINQIEGVGVTVVVAIGLMVVLGERGGAVLTTAVCGSTVMVVLQALSMDRDISVGVVADVTLTDTALASLVALSVLPVLALPWHRWTPAGRTMRIAGGVLCVVLPLIVALPAAAYIAAPQAAVLEASSFGRWITEEGAPVLDTLDECAGFAAPGQSLADEEDSALEGAAAFVDDVIAEAETHDWNSDAFRTIQDELTAALRHCHQGLLVTAEGDEEGARASFRAGLCAYSGALSSVESLGGSVDPTLTSEFLVCGF
jgi:hypothetical protein